MNNFKGMGFWLIFLLKKKKLFLSIYDSRDF